MNPVEHVLPQESMCGVIRGGAVTAEPARPAIEQRRHRALVALGIARDKAGMDARAPLRTLLDIALPPRCPGCGAVVRDDHRFCASCWSQLRFLGPPWCASCNLPFEHDRGEGALCAKCHADPPRHTGIRAAVAYGDIARTVALRLKYGGRTAFAITAARQMRRVMPEHVEILIPVPLHRWRLWTRGYNQAALIAGALSRDTGVEQIPDALFRTRATPLLRGLGARQRARAVAGAFAVDPKARDRLKRRAIALVDDIHTSGATANACTRALLKAGAGSVTILCWARVIGDALD